MASASVEPDSTSERTARIFSAARLFGCWVARMSSDWTRGRPALIIVANWRVKRTRSLVLTRPPIENLSSLGFSFTLTTTRRRRRSWPTTSASVEAVISPDWLSPATVRALNV